MKESELIRGGAPRLVNPTATLEATTFELAIKGLVPIEPKRMTAAEAIAGQTLTGHDQHFGHAGISSRGCGGA